MAGSGFNIFIGGKLSLEPKLDYVDGKELLDWSTEPEWMCMKELNDIIDSLGNEGEVISILYKRPHLSFSVGLNMLDDESDVKDMVEAWREDGAVNIYVVLDKVDGGKDDKVEGKVDNVEDSGGINVIEGSIVNSSEGSLEIDVGIDQQSKAKREAAKKGVKEEEPSNTDLEGDEEFEDAEEFEDDEDLGDVGYGTADDNEELNVYVEEYKNFIRNVAIRTCQKELGGKKSEHEDDEDSDYIVDSSEDWSLSEVSGDEANSDGKIEVEDVRRVSRKTYYNPDRPKLNLRTIFNTRAECRQAIIEDSVSKEVQIMFTKNDTRRVRAKCVVPTCPWTIYASYEKPQTELMVKTYVPTHTCSKSFENRYVTSRYLARRYLPLFRAAPTIKVLDFRNIVREQMNQSISPMKAYRAKYICRKLLVGDYNHEFSRLWNYAAEIGRTNPGSTVRIKHVFVEGDEKPHFQRIYICFAELRQGFLAACRPFIGLDGCFMKGMLKGQVLSAVGRDGNNQMYPFAWAVVEKECKESWLWFLELLKADIDSADGAGFTLISDQQKGLNIAVEMFLPSCEHRYCARHIYANWRKNHPGKQNQQIFWSCARSTTIVDFNIQIAKLDAQSREDLMRIHPSHWCKAFFKTHSSCDIVDNNLTEAFNASIVEARHMPIISMLEDIRRGAMKRILRKEEECKKWMTNICPRIRSKFEDTKDMSKWNIVFWGDEKGFEVSENQECYVVSIRDATCTCRVWDLQGIPCRHAVAAMRYKKINIDSHVSSWYTSQIFSDLYSKHHLTPMTGDKFWPESDLEPLAAPPFIKQTGRPKKKRIPEPGEGGTATKTSRKGRILRCHGCWHTGHNVRKCPIVKEQKAEEAAAAAAANVEDKAKGSSCMTEQLVKPVGKRKRGPGIQILDDSKAVPKAMRTMGITSPRKKDMSFSNYQGMVGNPNGASVSRIKKGKAVMYPTQQSRNG